MNSQLSRLSSKTREFLNREHRLLIDGRWVEPCNGARVSAEDPSTGEQIASVPSGDAADAERAVAAARSAFDDGRWRLLKPAERARALWRIADLIEASSAQLAELEAVDAGKIHGAALAAEVPAAAETFRYYAGWCTKLDGKTFEPSIPGLDLEGRTRLEPVGVAGLICPWNGPLVSASWKLAPALAAGCACILKPSEATSLSTLWLGEILQHAEVPDGVVNIVTGGGSKVGSALAHHPDVDKISFTGSTQTARSLVAGSASNMKKLSLELGGKSPIIVFEDADLEAAAAGAAEAIFSHAGQVCVAGARLYVQRGAYDSVVSAVAEIASGLRLGPTMEPETQMGPLISGAHRDRVAGFVRQGAADGAVVRAGGGPLDDSGGHFFEPTVLTDAPPDSCVVTDEIFGPVLVAAPFESEEEAVNLANSSVYGLAASVWTSDVSRTQRMTREIRAGIVWVNCHGIPDLSMPIGGYRQSGWGREHGFHGVEAYLEHKSIMQRA